MTFASIPAGLDVFLDANTLIYHFVSDPAYGPACTGLLQRVELREIQGFTSAQVIADVSHWLMTLEAISLFGWPATGIAARLRRHCAEIAKLSVYQQAVGRIPFLGIQVLPITQALVEAATGLSDQYRLLTGDALVLAVMQQHGLSSIASNDADFDRVATVTRYTPG